MTKLQNADILLSIIGLQVDVRLCIYCNMAKKPKNPKGEKSIMKTTKILALVLAVVMLAATCVACVNPNPGDDNNTLTDPYAGKTHAEISDAVYDSILGEFMAAYDKAKEATGNAERFALMAIAEAKLLGQGVMLPSTSNGGGMAISRVAPGTINSTLWGNDSDRFYSAIVVKGSNKPIKAAERDTMKAKWAELKGTGTYAAWAKEYLTGLGYELSNEYTLLYDSDPETWDALATSMAVDSEAIVNTYDSFLIYDAENRQIPSLAKEMPTVSADGLKYTFKLKEGVKWVDYQGKEIEELTAESFVKGMQHMLDAAGGLEYLVQGIIKNASEYLAKEVTDFAEVGVKAVDKYTVEYTLEAPTPFFLTMFAYNIFAPMSVKLFTENGGAFGVEEFAAASELDTYTYGKTPEKIGYCGPYLVTNFTQTNTIVFEKNPAYHNPTALNVDKITWRYTKGENKLEGYNLVKAGEIAGAGLNTDSRKQAAADGWLEPYGYVSATDATSFPMFLNLYRQAYANYNDATVAVSKLSDEEKTRTHLALLNKNFRLALVSGVDRVAYNAVTTGDDLARNSLVNSYTPGTFVTLDSEVTVKINGTDKTFPAGTFYGEVMQAQIDADGLSFKVWDPTMDGGIGSSAGYDGWYNTEKCVEYLNKAIDELKANGVEITAEKPIHIEFPYADVVAVFADRANALKASIEASTNGLISFDLIETGGTDRKNYNNATYTPSAGNEMNYHLNSNSGWGPDYGDPQTYLDTMLPEGAGYMVKCLGLY